MMIVRILLSPILFLVCAVASAQEAGGPDTNTRSPAEPDISISASVTAREVTFEKIPEGEVRLVGRDTLHFVRRTNLPDFLVPSVTYRDIGVQLLIETSLEQIISTMLGLEMEKEKER
jgi:hypothetical protein